ncbi:MAG TPA: sigma-70 family RNA polymerase sigma factor [Actinocrinis sp.]|nr:sigma-70 family RNA polymerase sigma factor [Actinocrinis sp.]
MSADSSVEAEADLLARLRAGREDAFAELVARYHSRLTRLAYSLGARGELVQDIAQETWVAVLRGLDRFEGRGSLQSWLFQICANRARTMTAREQRVIPLAPERFGPDGGWPEQDWTALQPWRQDDVPESERDQDAELAARIGRTIAGLDGKQGRVVALRDAQGMSSAQVCEILSISEANQRVLLHRGRARVRAALAVR